MPARSQSVHKANTAPIGPIAASEGEKSCRSTDLSGRVDVSSGATKTASGKPGGCALRRPSLFPHPLRQRQQTNMVEIECRSSGTTFAEISKQNFRPIRVVMPTRKLMAAFTAKVAPLYAEITANLHQSHTLATLRDTLQPKLLSGELSAAQQRQEASYA